VLTLAKALYVETILAFYTSVMLRRSYTNKMVQNPRFFQWQIKECGWIGLLIVQGSGELVIIIRLYFENLNSAAAITQRRKSDDVYASPLYINLIKAPTRAFVSASDTCSPMVTMLCPYRTVWTSDCGLRIPTAY
jgi:hypothetical protein